MSTLYHVDDDSIDVLSVVHDSLYCQYGRGYIVMWATKGLLTSQAGLKDSDWQWS